MTTALCGRFRDAAVVKRLAATRPRGTATRRRPPIRVRADRPRTRIVASQISEFLKEDR